jgi:hypothetical protein
MSSDGNSAVFVGTMLETGDAVALCDECMVPWAAALLNAMTGVDPTPFLVAISDDIETVELVDVDDVAAPSPADQDLDPPPPRSGRRGRTSAASPAAGTVADLGDDAPPVVAGENPPTA